MRKATVSGLGTVPKRRIIDGKTTPERIEEHLQRLREADAEERARMTIPEFAARVGISQHTLTHKYLEAATEVRAMRDADRVVPRRLSPASRKRTVTTLAEAKGMIADLQQQLDNITTRLAETLDRLEKAERRATSVPDLQDNNASLRGVVTYLQQTIFRYVPPERAQQIFEEMVELAEDDRFHQDGVDGHNSRDINDERKEDG